MTDAKPRRDAPTDTAERPMDTPDENRRRPDRTTQPESEIGGQKGPEPTRYGDWEKGGRCTDF